MMTFIKSVISDIIFVLTDTAWSLSGRIAFGVILGITLAYLIYTLVLLILPEPNDEEA